MCEADADEVVRHRSKIAMADDEAWADDRATTRHVVAAARGVRRGRGRGGGGGGRGIVGAVSAAARSRTGCTERVVSNRTLLVSDSDEPIRVHHVLADGPQRGKQVRSVLARERWGVGGGAC